MRIRTIEDRLELFQPDSGENPHLQDSRVFLDMKPYRWFIEKQVETSELLDTQDLERFISPEAIDEFLAGNFSLSLREFEWAVDKIVNALGPSPGLKLGRALSLSSHQTLGLAAMSASTVGQALALTMKTLQHRIYLEPLLSVYKSVASLELRDAYFSGPARWFFSEIVLSAIFGGARELSGQVFKLSKVMLPAPEPEDTSLYDQYFNCPIEFGCAKTIAQFDAAMLELPGVFSQEIVFKQYATLLEAERKPRPSSIVESFTEQVKYRLISDQGRILDAEEVAESLGCSERTLRRRLKQEGTNYKKILSDARYNLAKELLLDTELDIQEIANKLGYVEANSFTRAFNAWSGLSPRQWRSDNGLR